MSKLAIVVVALAALYIANTNARIHSTMNFYGDFHCPYPVFRYRLDVWEEDNIKDDHLGTFKSTSHSPHKFNITVEDYGDGNNWYEIYFLIVHNCTETGNNYETRSEVPDIPVVKGYTSNYTFVNVFELGSYTTKKI